MTSIIEENKGVYIGKGKVGVKEILKPVDGKIGTAASMLSQTEPTSILEDESFLNRKRGVAHVIDTIKNNKDFTITQYDNYNPQGEQGRASTFIIGGTDKVKKTACSRYSIKNPYRPGDAETLALSFKNYAMGENGKSMSFPPYIVSFQHGDSATWNSETFLGRPEPVYTYGNGQRDGSITFYVLTDYAQNVDIGYDCETGELINDDFQDVNFTKPFSNDHDSNESTSSTVQEIDAEIKSKTEELEVLRQQRIAVNEDRETDHSELEVKIIKLEKSINKLSIKRELLNSVSSSGLGGNNRIYSETSRNNANVYKSQMNGTRNINSGYIDSKPSDTIEYLSIMKQKLLFQPGYFSGSKEDFVNRMDFIARMTKPSRNGSSSGFSFIKPPICHMTLGDWINHDIVVNNVSYNYTDAPWTTDGGKKQPMWAEVTIQFNIIGKYGGSEYKGGGGGQVPLANDVGGFYDYPIE